MSPRAVDVSVDAREFVDLVGKTSKLEPALRRQLRKRIREAGTEGAKASKAEVLKAPTTVSRHRMRDKGLRRQMAAGIRVQIAAGERSSRVGVIIKSTGPGLAGERRKLIKRWDDPRGWRHPVFGDRETWVHQVGRPYFRKVLAEQKDQLAAKVRQALDEALADAKLTP